MKYWNAGIKKFPRTIVVKNPGPKDQVFQGKIKATEFHKKLDNYLTVS